MLQTESINQKKKISTPNLFVNLVFAFFPISFVLGSLLINVNLLLFCCLGIFYLRSKILSNEYDFSIKIIFLFFLSVFVSTSLSYGKAIYFEGFENVSLVKLTKSILFFRYFLFLIIAYLLNKFNILNFKYFFLTTTLSVALVSLDIIYQYVFGYNILGYKRVDFHHSGFFVNSLSAGGYIERFSFFAILFAFFISKNKNYTQLILTVIVICLLGLAIFLSGNRMPFILFLFGLFLVLLSNLKIKKILLISVVTLFILIKFILSSNEQHKIYVYNLYDSFISNVLDLTNYNSKFGIPYWQTDYIKSLGKNRGVNYEELVKEEEKMKEEDFGEKAYFYATNPNNQYKRLYSTAIYTWRANKIFGNGIKSFREDCQKLNISNLTVAEDLYRQCSTHPHNYYFEILTETGVVGLFIASSIGLLFIFFIFKNFRFFNQLNFENVILLSSVISLILETMPLRSTGSFFSTNNATYLILISSIVLSHKTLIKLTSRR